jgi:3-deoxy-manno-octulosonate cytidylyltransferase (CMP-KDO synthetase)
MDFNVVIPARYSSSRLPGKPLLDICGMTMIERVARQALAANPKRVIIATDDERILEVCLKIDGVETVLTSKNHNSGTERIAEVCEKLNISDDEIVVNVQGDEPLIPPVNIHQVANLLDNTTAPMATLCVQIEGEEVFNPNCVKVIMNKNNEAIYFSRAPIPYERNNFRDGDKSAKLGHSRHLGIYAYRAGFIKQYLNMPSCVIEEAESLEQLRVLFNGYKIMIDYAKEDPKVGVDTQEDLEEVRKIIAQNSSK